MSDTENHEMDMMLDEALEVIVSAFLNGGKLLICGNGGSAADSSHMAGELVKAFERPKRLPSPIREKLKRMGSEGVELAAVLQRGLPAISLAADGAVISAIANDIGGAYIFAQQVVALGRPGDVLFCISTSGSSPNIINAAIAAKAMGMTVIALTGGHSAIEESCDLALLTGGSSVAEVQARHLEAYHRLCSMIEKSI